MLCSSVAIASVSSAGAFRRLQRTMVQRRRVVEPSAVFVEHRQRVHSRQAIVVVGTEGRFRDRCRFAKVGFGLLVASEDANDIAERRQGLHVKAIEIGPLDLHAYATHDGHRSSSALFGLIVVGALCVDVREAREHVRDVGMEETRRALEEVERLERQRAGAREGALLSARRASP